MDYYSNAREEVVSLLSAPVTSVLDIGCGKGGVARSILQRFPDAQIVGLDRFAEDGFNYSMHFSKFLQCNLDEALPDLDYASFDLVLMLDVLEHLQDPWHFLRVLSERLKPGCVVLISVPNFINYSNLWSIVKNRKFSYMDSGILDRTHLRFFCMKDTKDLVSGSGIHITRSVPFVTSTSMKAKLLMLLLGEDFLAYQNVVIGRK